MRGFESAGEGVGWMTEVKLIQGMLEKNSSESASSPSSIEEAASQFVATKTTYHPMNVDYHEAYERFVNTDTILNHGGKS